MSFYAPRPGLPRFRHLLSSFLQHDSLHFSGVLSEETIETVGQRDLCSRRSDEARLNRGRTQP